MKPKPDSEHTIPVIDCPNCEKRNVALYVMGPFNYAERTLEAIWYCPHCGYVPVEEIKGYISLMEMQEIDIE